MKETLQQIQQQLQELSDRVNSLWKSRIRIDMPLVERNVIAAIAMDAAFRPFGGSVSSGGSAGTYFPSGWAVVRNSAGNYTITHNLGTTNYAPSIVPTAVSRSVSITSLSSAAFTVKTTDLAGTLTDTEFYFMVTK